MIDTLEQELLKQSDNPGALALFAAKALARGDRETAAAMLSRAVELKPTDPMLQLNLGELLLAEGRWPEAGACFARAAELCSEDYRPHLGLGLSRHREGRLEEAMASLQRAIGIKPDLAPAFSCLGEIHQARGAWAAALACYRKVLELEPRCHTTLFNLGAVHEAMGDPDGAMGCYGEAVALKPDYALAWYNLGTLHFGRLRLHEAAACFRRAAEHDPGGHDAWLGLGNSLKRLGRCDAAIDCFRTAIRLRPASAPARDNLLSTLNCSDQYTPEQVFRAHLEAGKTYAPLAAPSAGPLPRRPGEKLRIGYLSPDFRMHSVAFFIEPVLARHDRERFEITCYYNYAAGDRITSHLQGLADRWRETWTLDDAALADRIAADRIDILVDLAGHSACNRLPLFALRPAPVQMTWLGYPNTTGLSAMDYRITDGVADPAGSTERFHTEKLLRLPDSFLCYSPLLNAPAVTPRDPGLPVTFASFNNFAKVTGRMLSLWSRILGQVAGSRLLLKGDALADPLLQVELRNFFGAQGIAGERLLLVARDNSILDHLERYNSVDLALDTHPYNGTTTTCEALWMGTPVLTLAGITHPSRVGASILGNVGLSGLVTETEEAYVAAACNLAGDLPGLSRMRMELRERMAASPLCDPLRFTRRLEEAYVRSWKESQAPETGPAQ